MSYFEEFTEKEDNEDKDLYKIDHNKYYLDIEPDTINDFSFNSPNDAKFNPNQYKLYNQMNKSLDYLNKPINEDLKQIRINTYYYKRYKSENHILYFIMIILFIVIIISIIKKRMPFLDDVAYSIIVGGILALSLIYISICLYKLMIKDNHNYDEDDYHFSTSFDFNDLSDISNNCENE